MLIEVIPEKRTNPEKDSFSYLVPEKLQDNICLGAIVSVPFGRKTVRGVVSGIIPAGQEESVEYEIKEIVSVDNRFVIPEKYLDLAKWISEYYLCSLGEAIGLFMPGTIIRPRKPAAVRPKSAVDKITLSKEQQEIFDALKTSLRSPKHPALLHGVTGSGKTEIYIKLVEENIKNGKQAIILVPEIMLATQVIAKFEESFPGDVCLMHSNLSKSEKFNSYTDFYNNDKKIIIGPRSALLVPSNNLGLIIIDEEQEDAYKQEKNPRYHAVRLAEEIAHKLGALLVLGTATPSIESYARCSASTSCHPEQSVAESRDPLIEIPFNKKISPTVQQSSRGRNDTVGLMGRDDNAPGDSENVFDLFALKNRFHSKELPPAEVIDLKNEIKYKNYSPISTRLQEELKIILEAKKQAILFINRRGAATFISCRDCGFVVTCPNCSIPMVYHINENSNFLNCHHCDHKDKVPHACPDCGGVKIKHFGVGIEKIVLEVKKLFPEARIAQADAKTLENKGEYQRLYRHMKNGEIDILIGTQIVAKGLDLPEVDLVGVVSADTGLHMPYFRANEKTFQILTQVSGRSGRKNNSGKTIIQTYWPESRAIKYAAKHDFEGFYKEEIADRVELSYPPYSKIIRVVSEDGNKIKAKKALEDVKNVLLSSFQRLLNNPSHESKEISKQAQDDTNFDLTGPAPCFLSRINNQFRYHLIIKVSNQESSVSRVEEILRSAFISNPYLTWDVDPTNLL